MFEGKKFCLLKVTKPAYTHYTDSLISANQLEGFSIDPVNSRWTVPPLGYRKLNVDGGFRDGRGVFGGVLRDKTGAWLWGIRGRSYATDLLHAEIIALKMGLQVLRLKAEGRVIIETDSSTLVNLFQDVVAADHPRAEVLQECRDLLNNIMFATVYYVPRTCNWCAHLLANSGYN